MNADSDRKSDEYLPLARALPIVDWLLEYGLRHIRGDVTRILEARGAQRILDVGCGTGSLSRRLAEAGIPSICLDISPTMLAQAARKARRPPTFPTVLGDARRLPYMPQFDAVILSLVLHEMDPSSRQAAWEEAHRVLRSGGFLVVVDYVLPRRAGWLARRVRAFLQRLERFAGRSYPPHYAGYRDFMEHGGLHGWVQSHNDTVLEERRYYAGNLALLVIDRHCV